MRWKKNIIRTMNRLTVVRSSAGGGVAHSTASKIPWQKRNGAVIQSGGSTWKYFKRTGDMLTGRRKPQKGGFWKSLERSMFGIKRTRGRRKPKPAVIHSAARKQKGGLLGLGRLERWQKGRSKEQRKKDAAWARKNL